MSKFVAIRLPIVLCVVLAVLGGLWAALMRVGWRLPPLTESLAAQHAALMISGFLGVLVSMERAVALQKKWAYAAPLPAGLGGLALLLSLLPEIGRGLITCGSIGLMVIFAFIYRLHLSVDVITSTLRCLMWLTGSLLWLFGPSVVYAMPWWAGFLIMTIAGERIELSRVLMLKPISEHEHEVFDGLAGCGALLHDGEAVELKPGDACFIPAGVYPGFKNTGSERWLVRVTIHQRIYACQALRGVIAKRLGRAVQRALNAGQMLCLV